MRTSSTAVFSATDTAVRVGESDFPAASAGASALRYAPALLLLAIAIADCGRFADTDLWGHLYFGNLLLHAGPHINSDPFSYLPHHTPWLHHEWLSEVLMSALYGVGGIRALKLWKFAFSAVTMLMIADAQDQNSAAPSLRIAMLFPAAFALIPYMQFRPMVMAFALVAVLFVLLTRDNRRPTKGLWIAIPLLAVWANLHGSFFVGLAMLAVYAAIRGGLDLRRGVRFARAARPAVILAIASPATLLTPYGLNTWRAVAISLRNPMTRHIMADWRPLFVVLREQWRQPHGGAIFLIIAVIMMGAFGASWLLAPDTENAALDAIAAMMCLGAVTAVRNTPLAIITVTPAITRHVGLLWARRTAPDASKTATVARLGGLTQGVLAAVALMLTIQSGLYTNKLPAATQYPTGALKYMREHRLSGHILNDFAWGQYLIWHTAPRSKIFIDGRFDLVYTPDQIRDYLMFFNASPGAARVLAEYPHDYILIPNWSPAAKALQSNGQWRAVYRDNDSVLFVRAASGGGLPVVIGAPPRRSVFP